jgi:hypothetical protein
MEEPLKLQSEMVGRRFDPNLEIYDAFLDGYFKQVSADFDRFIAFYTRPPIWTN